MTHFYSILYNARTFIAWLSVFILFVTGIAPLFVGFTYGALFLPSYMYTCMVGPEGQDVKGLTDIKQRFSNLEESTIDLSYEFYLRNWRCAATECASGTPDERIPACSAVIRSNPRDPKASWAYTNRAGAYLKRHNYSGAIEDETNAIEIDPKNADAEAYYNLGVAYGMNDDHDEAIADFKKAIEIVPENAPENARAYVSRGIEYGRKADRIEERSDIGVIGVEDPANVVPYYDKAIADFEKAIEIDQKYAEAYYPRGLAYYKRGFAYLDKCDYDKAKGDNDRAIKYFGEAIKIDRTNADAYYFRGVAYGMNSDHDKAIAEFDNAIKIDPKNAFAYYSRGVAYLNKGYYDKAITDETEVINASGPGPSDADVGPSDADAYYIRGRAYGMKGDNDNAIADFDTVIKMDWGDAKAYYYRGNAYENLGKKIEAIADYRSTLSLSQSDTDIQAAAQAALRRLGADPVKPNANTQTVGEQLGIGGIMLPTDTGDLNRAAAIHDPADPRTVCPQKRKRFNLSMGKFNFGTMGEIDASYRGAHQYFNDDIVGDAINYYYKSVAWPFFQRGIQWGAETTISFFNHYWIARTLYITIYFLVFFFMYELGKHIFYELFYKNLKRLIGGLRGMLARVFAP